ncbi:MAG TPA: flagellar biosynthesis anti-sigma factor FlgM [Lysobacter sp.]|nr:flagellar biosynthesis anti-sigma factor FlgM [Lysobacter sp.]
MSNQINGNPMAARAVELASTGPARARAGEDRSQPVAATPPADSMRLTGEAAGLQALERSLGAAPAGIDVTKVNAVRAALADGSYRIDPEQIATRMLAFEEALQK